MVQCEAVLKHIRWRSIPAPEHTFVGPWDSHLSSAWISNSLIFQNRSYSPQVQSTSLHLLCFTPLLILCCSVKRCTINSLCLLALGSDNTVSLQCPLTFISHVHFSPPQPITACVASVGLTSHGDASWWLSRELCLVSILAARAGLWRLWRHNSMVFIFQDEAEEKGQPRRDGVSVLRPFCHFWHRSILFLAPKE